MSTCKSKLPRLGREWYQGPAVVFWTHTFECRATGWLREEFHLRFREVLLHCADRYSLICPSYTLMPDHWHLMWMGLRIDSDQRLATAFLREHLAPYLGTAKLQDRPHDHVLRERERQRGAFESVCHYIRENPVRAGLCENWKDWPFLGASVAGYPDLDPRDDNFWERFWRIFAKRFDSPL
jgi:putative transposase